MDELSTPVVLAGAFALVAVPTLGLWGVALSGGTGGGLVLLAVGVPLAVVLGVGILLGRKVAASPDDPHLVDEVVADSLGESREELEELFE